MCDAELAYIAGYLDGEGSVFIRHEARHVNSYRVQVKIGNTYKPVLDQLKERFGGSLYAKPLYKTAGAKMAGRQFWEWVIHGKGAYNFLVQISPCLREKAVQAEEAMDFYRAYGGRNGWMRDDLGNFMRGTREQQEDKEARYLRMKALKRVEYTREEEGFAALS